MINSKIEISGTQIIKTLLIIGGIFAFMIMGSDVLLPLMVAVITAVLLDKPTKKLTKWGIPNIWAIVISVSLMVVVSYILTPCIIGDETDLNCFTIILGVILLSTIWGTDLKSEGN